MLDLVITRGGREVVALPLEGESYRIGRAGTNDLALPDPTVSRHQCELVLEAGQVLLQDRSGQGTRVDGRRCERRRLDPGARLEFGELSLVLRRRMAEQPATTLAGGGTGVLPGGQPRTAPVLLKGRHKGRRLLVRLKGDVLTVGSDPGNDVVIEDDYVSAFHCRLLRRDDGWHVTDLGSTNGTYVNDVQVGEALLAPGALLTIGRVRLTMETPRDQEDDQPPGRYGIVSRDPVMRPVFDAIERSAPTDETVLITGESGAGKELVARAVHTRSRRAEQPLITLNCSAITRELIESELFGHEKGAFTGAQVRRRGLFEAADQGTLFLDEIGELALDMQAKLLRTLENGEIRRVGSNTPLQVDVRVLAATHRSLPQRVQRGAFREDLYYRVCVIQIDIPPLRKRPRDIRLLARHFLQAATATCGTRTLSQDALDKLAGYSFPGNVRELKHAVTRAAIMCPAETIEADQLVFTPPTLADQVAESQLYRKGKTLRQVEDEAIRQVLDAHDWNQKAAAKVLGIARSTLIHKMDKYGITPDEPE